MIVITPVGGQVRAERPVFVLRVATGTRVHVENANLEYIAGLRTADISWAVTDVDTSPTTGYDRRIHRDGAPLVHVLLIFRPVVNTFRPRISFDHSLIVIAGLMSEAFQGNKVSGFDLDDGLETLAEVTPVNRLIASG